MLYLRRESPIKRNCNDDYGIKATTHIVAYNTIAYMGECEKIFMYTCKSELMESKQVTAMLQRLRYCDINVNFRMGFSCIT